MSRYRCLNLVEGLRAAGGNAVFSYQFMPEPISISEDIVVLHRCIWDEGLEAFIGELRASGRSVVYGLDDLLFDPEWPIKEASEYFPPGISADRQGIWDHIYFLQQGVLKAMLLCDCVLVSTELIAERVRKLGKEAYCLRNMLGEEQLALSSAAKRDHPLRGEKALAGYLAGTNTHNADLASIEGALASVLSKDPNLMLLLVGPVHVPLGLQGFERQVRQMPVVDWRVLPSVIATLDFLVTPLDLTFDFNHAKSHIKWLEAAAVEVPAIASRTEEFERSVESGRNGFLAATGSEWEEQIGALASDRELRKRMGETAGKDALQFHTAAGNRSLIASTFGEIFERYQGAGKPSATIQREFGETQANMTAPRRRRALGPFRFAGKAYRAAKAAFRGEI